MEFKKYLYCAMESVGVDLDESIAIKLETYKSLLIEWNEKINLTAITDEEEVAYKHFADSLAVFNSIEIKEGSKIIDVGTGAGFPGLPMKIYRPDLEMTLLDSLNKRINFLKLVGTETNTKNINYLHARAEDSAHDLLYREKFDYAVARAVASLNILLEYCLPYVKEGGYFLAFKGKNTIDEISDAQKALEVLGGRVEKIFEVPKSKFTEGHQIIIIKKIKKTPKVYPRKAGTPTKKPL